MALIQKDGEQVFVTPLKVEFHPKDILQVIIGATILAIPVGLTEETWELGITLPLLNIFGFLVLSLLFISAFTYYNYYRHKIHIHMDKFLKRTFSTYLLSFIVVALLMLMILPNAVPESTILTMFKTTVIVAFPASMSGAIADMLH